MSDEQMTTKKVVDIEKLYNFVVEHFLIWIKFANEKYVWSFELIWNLIFLNHLGWRNNQNKSFRSRKVMKLCSWQPKLRLNLSNLEFKFFKWTRMGKQPKWKL